MLDPQHSVEICVTLSSVSHYFDVRNKEMNFKASICNFRVEGLAESPPKNMKLPSEDTQQTVHFSMQSETLGH
jgi:hypothetical protein